MKNFFNNRRFKHGSLATVIVALFIVAVVIINVIATLLLERYPLSIDLTKEKRFTISDESINFVKKIDTKVDIVVLSNESNFKDSGSLAQPYEIINGYAKYNKNISITFIDMAKQPDISKDYPNEQLKEGDIIVKSDMRFIKFPYTDLFGIEQNDYKDTRYSSFAEQRMTSALMHATDKNPTIATVLGGQENADISGYVNLLKTNNYQIKSQNILSEEIDPESQLVVLSAPKTDFTSNEIKKLEDFLDNDGNFGKSLIFFASYDAKVGPVLQAFLADWGIEITSEIVGETDARNAINDIYMFRHQVVDEEIKKGLKMQSLDSIVVYPVSIKTLFEEKDNRTTSIISKTYSSAINSATMETGEYNTAVKGSRSKVVNNEKQASNVVAICSAQMVASNFLEYGAINNADFVLTITNNTVKKDTLKIVPITITNETMLIDDAQGKTINFVFIFIIPALIIGVMVFIWVRRRHL